jgi:methionine salvage enolase-phosphatase E1
VVTVIAELRDAWHDEDPETRQPTVWPPAAPEAAIEYATWLISQDRKLTPLKVLQGFIWEEAYREGRIVAPVYADVTPALTRWAAQGCPRRSSLRAACLLSGCSSATRPPAI